MGNLNKVFLMGNMTRDPELRYTPSGTPVCDFGLAINRRYTSQGEQREETCFVDITFWSRRAEVISEYFGKGDQILVEGRLKLDQWETPEGRRSKLNVVGDNFEFVGQTSGSSGGGGGGSRGGRPRQNQRQASQGGGQSRGGDSSPQGGGQSRGGGSSPQDGGGRSNEQESDDAGYDVSDDEIPF